MANPAGAVLIALVKPQFECDRSEVGEGGIVKDEEVRARVLASITSWFVEDYSSSSWQLCGTIESPITGQDGNVEYLLVAKRTASAL